VAAHIVDPQKVIDLTAIVNAYNIGGYEIGLYKTGISVDHTTTFADLVEADFSGYVRVNLTGGVVDPTVDGSFRGTATFALATFSRSSGPTSNDIYGYFVCHSGTNALAWIQPRDDAGFVTMSLDGQTYLVLPKYRSQNDPAP
jgi:hypothetical protein